MRALETAMKNSTVFAGVVPGKASKWPATVPNALSLQEEAEEDAAARTQRENFKVAQLLGRAHV